MVRFIASERGIRMPSFFGYMGWSCAMLLPVFDFTARNVTHSNQPAVSDEALSLAVSAVLLLLHGGNLAYTLVTHRDVFASGKDKEGDDGPPGSASPCSLRQQPPRRWKAS